MIYCLDCELSKASVVYHSLVPRERKLGWGARARQVGGYTVGQLPVNRFGAKWK